MDAETARKNELLQRLFDTAFYDEPGTHWRGYADPDPDDEGPDEDEVKAGDWREEDHPREPAGSSDGGQFTDGDADEDPWEQHVKQRDKLVEQLAAYKVIVKGADDSSRDQEDVIYLLKSSVAACQKMDQAGLKFSSKVWLDMEPIETDNPNSGALAHYVSHGLTIQFNLNPQGGSINSKETYNRDIKEELPWTVAGKLGTIGTFIHEYGHHVDYALRDSSVRERIHAREEVMNAFYSAQPPHTNSNPHKGLSRYAMTNDTEFFAESFAAVFSNDADIQKRLPEGTYKGLREKFRKLGVLKK